MDPIIDIAAFDAAIGRLTDAVATKRAELELIKQREKQLGVEIGQFLERIRAATAVRQEADKLARVLKDVLGDLGPPEDSTAQKTNFDKIVDFLVAQNNRPQTIAEIEEGTSIPRSSVSAVLYRTHSDRFIVDERPGKQANTWRLKGYRFADDESFEEPANNSGEEIPF